MTQPNRTSQTLLVLCCHPPAIDPRIKWSAEFGCDYGLKTSIIGFSHKPNKQPAPTSEIPEITLSPKDPGISNRKILWLMLRYGISPHGWDLLIFVPFAIIFGFAAVLLWSLNTVLRGAIFAWKWAFSSLRFLPKGQAIINLSSLYTRRYLRPVFTYISQFPAKTWRVLLGGRFRPLIEALRGYYWYFFSHSTRFAAALLHLYPAGTSPPDIIHAHDPDALLGAILLRAKYGCKVIYDAHEYGPDAYIIRPRPRFLFFAFERLLLAHVDAAVTVSPILMDMFNKRFSGKPEFQLLPNASPLSDRVFTSPTSSDLTRLANGRIAVLFQGGFSEHRGVEWIIKEWALLAPNTAALFIRGPMNSYRETLLEHAKNTGLLGTSIYFLDSVDEDQLIAEASIADIGIIPYHSHIENHHGACPNKLSQYMIAGLAVISSPLPYVEQIIKAAQCGRVFNDQIVGNFGEVLSELLKDKEVIAKLGQAGNTYAYSHFNYDICGKVLIDLYKQPNQN